MDAINAGVSVLSNVIKNTQDMVNEQIMREALKCRESVTTHLISDGWQSQAIEMLEENREFQKKLCEEQGKPVQFFRYEMQILNYSKELTKKERYQRFNELVNMDLQTSDPVTGQLIGAGLIWARACFDKKQNEIIKMNTWVKLHIEFYTRLKTGIDLSSIEVKLNEHAFNFAIEGSDLKLTRDKPLSYTKDIYLDENVLLNSGDLLVVNQFLLKLKGKNL